MTNSPSEDNGGFDHAISKSVAYWEEGGSLAKIILEVAYKEHPERVFMQDNARTHIIPEIIQWFEEKGIYNYAAAAQQPRSEPNRDDMEAYLSRT